MVSGRGDVTYNLRRKILGAIPLDEYIDYHIFKVDAASENRDMVKLLRKAKWHAPEEGMQSFCCCKSINFVFI